MPRVTYAQHQAVCATKDARIAELEAANTKLRRKVETLKSDYDVGERALHEPRYQAALPIDRPGDPCGRCGGTGQYGRHGECYLCRGTGKFPGKKTAAIDFAKRRSDRDARPVSARRAAMDTAKAEAQRTGRSVAVR